MPTAEFELGSLDRPEPGDGMQPGQHESAGMLDVLTELARRKALIGKCTGVAIVIGVVVSLLLPVRFTATAKIMPPQQTQSTASMLMSQLSGLAGNPLSAMAGASLGVKSPNDLYIGLLESRSVADPLIEQFHLQQVYKSRNMTQARQKLGANTSVTSEKSGLIAISVTDKDKKRAADVANAYTEQLRVLTKTLETTEASRRRFFYEQQLKQVKDALVAAALAFEQVQQKKGLVQPDAQAKAMIAGLADLRAKVAAKEVEVEALRSYSTEKNPEVEIAERELGSMRAEEARMEQNSQAPGIASLGLGNVPSAGLEYLRAEHELGYQQALYDMLMKQYDAARLDESKDAAIIQVVEPAIEPDQKSAPKRALLVLLFTSTGFFIGSIWALVLFQMEKMKANPQEFAKLENLMQALSFTRTRKAVS